MSSPSAQILSAYDMKGALLRNRLAVAPMTRVTASETGAPTPAMHDYYVRFAKGGFGMVISEGLYTDQAFAQGYRNQAGMADDVHAHGWAAITREITAHGSLAIAQLMHAGALSQENPFRSHTVGPSALRPKGEQMGFYHGAGPYAEPVQIDEHEIAEVVAGFVSAAARAVRIGGFGGIEIHGANGYLLDQFLTAETNRRTDRWGGDTGARVSLLVEVLEAVKAEIGGEVPVGIRISQGKVNDFTSKWAGREADAQATFSALAAAGADFIHVTEFEAWQPAFEGGTDSLVALARRYAPGVPIIANGSLHSVERAAQALELGADVVALGRGALANPDLPALFAQGRAPREFDGAILGPIANIKESELAFDKMD
ncbi:NADH:flavin oxidoreductase [Massilia sp. CMS3.1]|uniref:NADH:flavin oxidoreductase n=1 Tax=Massilia sp. CMS3.1 TaxID=3373083 RepID=UPI003EE5466F